ncbi:MAG TPA: DUF2958 domain-containing protein [Vicinamibacterales bacterium]|jgi:hypothetical protein|nr:DUF2958 domain-containing protein [Vicinamibacterales bacterium]
MPTTHLNNQLFPDDVRRLLPPLYSQESLGEQATVFVKFFTPDSSWSWFATEFDGNDTFFGLVVGHDTELGYFSLAELRAVRGPLRLPIERDEHFTPTTLAEIRRLS